MFEIMEPSLEVVQVHRGGLVQEFFVQRHKLRHEGFQVEDVLAALLHPVLVGSGKVERLSL